MKKLSIKQMTVLVVAVGIAWLVGFIALLFSTRSDFGGLVSMGSIIVLVVLMYIFAIPLSDRLRFRHQFKTTTGLEAPVSSSVASVDEWWAQNTDSYQEKRKSLEDDLDNSINELRVTLGTEALPEYSDFQRSEIYSAVSEVFEKRNTLMNFLFTVNDVKTS